MSNRKILDYKKHMEAIKKAAAKPSQQRTPTERKLLKTFSDSLSFNELISSQK